MLGTLETDGPEGFPLLGGGRNFCGTETPRSLSCLEIPAHSTSLARRDASGISLAEPGDFPRIERRDYPKTRRLGGCKGSSGRVSAALAPLSRHGARPRAHCRRGMDAIGYRTARMKQSRDRRIVSATDQQSPRLQFGHQSLQQTLQCAVTDTLRDPLVAGLLLCNLLERVLPARAHA